MPVYTQLIILESLSVIQDRYQLLMFPLLSACWSSRRHSDGRRTIICCLWAVTDDSASQGKQLNDNYTHKSSHKKCSFPVCNSEKPSHSGKNMTKSSTCASVYMWKPTHTNVDACTNSVSHTNVLLARYCVCANETQKTHIEQSTK